MGHALFAVFSLEAASFTGTAKAWFYRPGFYHFFGLYFNMEPAKVPTFIKRKLSSRL
jgi:hypothetical protein